MKTLLGIVLFLFLCGMVFAHPVDSVKMSFDSTDTILTI